MIASYSKTAAFSLTYCNSRYLFMWRSRVLYACVYSRGEDASDLTFCSWKVSLWRIRNCRLPRISARNSGWPFQCPWSDLFDMHPMKDASAHCTYSEIGFPLIWNKYLQTSLEHAMNTACELPTFLASTSRCSSSKKMLSSAKAAYS